MYTSTVFLKDTGSSENGTQELYNAFVKYLRDHELLEEVQPVRVLDIGVYDKGWTVKFFPNGPVYCNVSEADIPSIIEETIQKGALLEKFCHKPKAKQVRIVLRNCGVIDPDSIDSAIAQGGYQALKKVLADNSPDKVIEELKVSGLRGRGGAGFPTWMKWKFARAVDSAQKYIICNGDEGDPGAYMDRSVLEGDPHAVIEGMIIGGFAVGASKGFFYIRAEYPLAIERIQRALDQAYEYGLLGQGVLGSTFNFDIEIRLGAGAFVCGEETALIASIEGKRGTPTPRPPYPSVKGLWEKPTVINNVETLANIAPIITRGAAWFSSIGTAKSKGTKVFALTGKIKNSGLIEVPMGITLREIIYDIGGGVDGDKPFKAVQTGGPSGGFIPEQFLDTQVDYENLQKLGTIMGSGGMIVMDTEDCIVDIAKFYLGFCVDESCGKCVPCRIGGYQMLQILNAVTEGIPAPDGQQKMSRICTAMQKASLCGLGQSAPNPVVSTMRFFEDELREHIEHKKCRAGKCSNLVTYTIIADKCKRCGLCVLKCPVNAISGSRQEGYVLAKDKCIKCGVCRQVCRFGAVGRE